ncbi:UDP-N-acetylenolpyruvoylglucosamine reductase [Formosa sp. Hel1_33_131]|jgi:UDP-N-acetylmuramate dehydrogenase|uniref:UDP-N-acetylmuramate dehydrogenase n=1 Tax=Formosa sp. Hel1_33_131 TaxID=1336794 RepID=UPI00084E1098|nr:UDP-N-acetylmuramate dehydrogenase [Formosa sp. Hel1_33_131]AOR27630.1 UDP-N-acetylenolpyruvoylglucosamine reductase [Formosa sp. Hel1_33_131]
MIIKNNITLKPFNTFGIDVKATEFASINSIQELRDVLNTNPTDLLILGGGSNILLTKDVEALVLQINLKGISVISRSENSVQIEVAAGENWHELVCWCLNENFGGLENLSLIPGNVGTAPIQNIGAYGVELKDSFVSCEALNIKTKELRTFTKEECQFGYRNSIFKQELKGQYIITSVVFELSNQEHSLKTNYGAIETELQNYGIKTPTIQDISKAVISIRNSKLPDPKTIGNSGSFFKNPVVTYSKFEILQTLFPQIQHYKISTDVVKIPAGWLIDTAGFKGKTFGNFGVHAKQALVLVNYGGASGMDILNLSIQIQKAVKFIFDIDLETEVNIL